MKTKLERVGAFTLAFIATSTLVGVAAAQDAQASGQASTQTGGQAGMTLPGAAPRAVATVGESDHDAVVGTLAVGYMGRRGINVGSAGGGGGLNVQTISAPIIGMRYWLDEMLGIDAGIGFGLGSTSAENNGATQDGPSSFAFLLHGGVPLSLADAGHFSFQVIPEANIGFGSWTQTQPGAPGDLKGSGFMLDIGARAGAEVHFGFMGLPKLSLQGNIGLYFRTESQSVEDTGVANSKVGQSAMSLATTVLDNPWNIFTSNVAALYYF